MTQANAPIDVGQEQIATYKKDTEAMLNGFSLSGATAKLGLADLILKLDKAEDYVMSDMERETYLSVREGMQVYKAIIAMVGEKIGLQKTIAESTRNPALEQRVQQMRGFTNNFATYVASRYVSTRLGAALTKAGFKEGDLTGPEVKDLAYLPEKEIESVWKGLVAPIYMGLNIHTTKISQFSSDKEFAAFVKKTFDLWGTMAYQRRDAAPDLQSQIMSYQWRIMGDNLVLQGYEDKSAPVVKVTEKPSFTPVSVNEIVGNRLAKREIKRFAERLCLHDEKEGKNPILYLGGLPWTVLFDGPPGTGKSTLFRLMMTEVDKHASVLGLPWVPFFVDQSIKDEYYGKTGKILLSRLETANDPTRIAVGIFDDLDLLTSTRSDAQGADNDINNILMQYLDGAKTVRRGNVINLAASNKPTGLDDALRNRFAYRVLIDGPVDAEDFADMLHMQTREMQDLGIIKMQDGYDPYKTQGNLNEKGVWVGAVDKPTEIAAGLAEKFKGKGKTIMDFGRFMAGLKAENPKITGRSAKAIIDAIKARAADFDIPQDWLTERARFHEQPWDKKLSMLKELYRPITPEMLFEEAQRYFDSEQRYATTERDEQVTRALNQQEWGLEAQIRFYEQELERTGDESLLIKLNGLKEKVIKKHGGKE